MMDIQCRLKYIIFSCGCAIIFLCILLKHLIPEYQGVLPLPLAAKGQTSPDLIPETVVTYNYTLNKSMVKIVTENKTETNITVSENVSPPFQGNTTRVKNTRGKRWMNFQDNITTVHFPGKRCFHLTWSGFNLSSLHGCRYLSMSTKKKGRIGNKMFQISAMLDTAYRLDMVPVFRKKLSVRFIFELPNLSDMEIRNAAEIGEKSCCVFYNFTEDPGVTESRNISLDGLRVSWRYFIDIEKIVLRTFRFQPSLVDHAQGFLKNKSLPGVPNVCLHVRRGDYLSNSLYRNGFRAANITYINNAISFMRTKLDKFSLFVVSDEIKWCKQNIKGPNVHYSPFSAPGDDMALMANCDHVITTTGTFGWWGAWFAGGISLYFSGHPQPGSRLAMHHNATDNFPRNWVGLM